MTHFIHTADWQIGRQYGQFDADDAPFIAEARFTAVERIAALATARAVDAVLVAGDVFDTQTVSDRTIHRLFNAMQGFAGRWLMIPGNHDAALAESVWQRASRLGAISANVEVFLQPGVREFAEYGFALLAAPLTQRHTHNDLTEFFDSTTTTTGLARIGLAHGCVQGILAEGIDSPNPIAPDRAQRARLDYLALGDWHGGRRIDDRTWYSGTPETDRFKTNESGQVLEVYIAEAGATPQVTAHATGQFRWQQWEDVMQVDSDLDHLLERLQTVSADDVIDLHLAGQLDLAGRARLQAALTSAEARVRSLTTELGQLQLLPTEGDLAALQADGYLGEVILDLKARQAEAGGEVAREALVLLAGLLSARTAIGGVA